MNARPRSLGRIGPTLVVIGCSLFFVLPLLAMARFSFQGIPMIRLGWSTLFDRWSLDGVTRAFGDQEFQDALRLSLTLAVGTVLATLALLLPTTLWVHLRIPRARPLVEFLTVLALRDPAHRARRGGAPAQAARPLVPQLELLADPVLRGARHALHVPLARRGHPGDRRPHARRRVRSLGAGWGTTMRRVLIPNLRAAIISASFLTAAVVLGEYTMARVLLKRTVPAFMAQYQSREPQGGMALALTAHVATTVLFAVLALLTRQRGGRRISVATAAGGAAS